MDWMDAMDYKDVAYQHEHTRLDATDGFGNLANVMVPVVGAFRSSIGPQFAAQYSEELRDNGRLRGYEARPLLAKSQVSVARLTIAGV